LGGLAAGYHFPVATTIKRSNIVITKEQYEQASKQKDEAQEVINTYFKEKSETFTQRLIDNPVFTDDDLFYSATNLCPCGHGLAYPKDCGGNHYWDCSAILKGAADVAIQHTDRLPFNFYDIKGESGRNGTTRGVFLPKQSAAGWLCQSAAMRGHPVDNIVKRVLLNPEASKAAKVARGESLTQPIRLVDRKPPADPLADFYGKIRDTAKLTDGITLAERIAVLDVVRAELVASFQAQIDAAEIDEV
jgi:hypothetical protein